MSVSLRRLGVAVVTGLTASLGWAVATAESEVRELNGFSAVAVSGGIDLEVRQGDEYRVEVENSGGSPEAIVTTVEDGTLTIRQSRTTGWFDWFSNYSVNVTMPDIAAIQSSGGSSVRIEGAITGDRLGIAASGGSDIAAAIDVADLEVTTSGGADLRLSGTAMSVKIQASGGSDVNARDLSAARANIQTSGGADVALGVSEQLVAQASGGSDIVYTGEPAMVSVNASGGADITQR